MTVRTFVLTLSVALVACTSSAKLQSSTNEMIDGCPEASPLIEAIDAVDTTAISTALRSTHCFDGGEIEDLYRALGVAFSREPDLVTRQVLNAGVQAEYVVPMMTMLPLSYVDDPCGSIDELERRRTLILEADMPPDMKQVLAAAVDNSLERDRRHCSAE